MKKTSIIIILMTVLCGVGVNAQRPVGDTINLGGGDYLYYPMNPTELRAYWPHMGNTFCFDGIYQYYYMYTLLPLLQGLTTDEDFLQLFPNLASWNSGRYITGEEIPLTDNVRVIGLAVCPTIFYDIDILWTVPFARLLPNGRVGGPVDTTIANRETEYVQLYTIEGGQPQLQAEGAWRWEYPHRYMMFPKTASTYGSFLNNTSYAALFEVMFDTGVVIDIEKQTLMVAGTHNNNGAVWSQVMAGDTVYTTPRICWEHFPTTYSTTIYNVTVNSRWWARYDTLLWDSVVNPEWLGGWGFSINIFPILDTLFGTPCAAVTGLDTAGVDSVWATLMWSADARQHDWEVWYRPTGDTVDGGAVVTVAVPTVTLTGLMPGTEYSVAVRGRCDIDNYSPWSDTLLFTTTQDTTEVIDTTTIDTTQTQGIQRLGNLDRFTRIMPNPASEVVNVLSSYRLESIAVYDLTGRLMLEQPAEGISAMVKVGSLPRGTYIMAIRTQQGVATKKLVVVEGN